MSYQNLLHQLAPDLNPAGVEAAMRNQYGVLGHLPRETFAAECRIARDCERAAPGFLSRCAASQGLGADFARWQRKMNEASHA